MSLTIHSKYKYFNFTLQRAEDRRQKFHFCRLLFAVNVMLNLSIIFSRVHVKRRTFDNSTSSFVFFDRFGPDRVLEEGSRTFPRGISTIVFLIKALNVI